jgi:DNA-binding NarL/FixJ family response regulator
VQTPEIKLTKRQQQVIEHMAEGLSNKSIGRKLNLSRHTIDSHVGALRKVFCVSARVKIVVLAMRQGLIK